MTLTTFNPLELIAVLPEIALALWALVILAVDMLTKDGMKRRTLGMLTAIGMFGVLLLSFVFMPRAGQPVPTVLGDLLRNDMYTFVFRAIFIVAGAITALIAGDFRSARAGGEFYALLILATMAMSFMAASVDIVMLYLATETASISLYLLAGFMRDTPRSAEAGMKYFVFGAVASTIMLFGLSLIYGASGGQTGYPPLSIIFQQSQPATVALATQYPDAYTLSAFGLLLVLVGFMFKTSAVPFHFWAPDVYEGAPTPVSGFLSTASKAAGFAVLMRFIYYAFPPGIAVPGYVPLANVWVVIMQPIAILTMFLGNLLAVAQTNVKRMLAYSSIAQAGYMLMGATAFGWSQDRADALASIIFYVGTYMVCNISAFAIVGAVSQRIGAENVKDFTGMSRRSPYLALAMVACLLSLTGAPPLVGFIGKLFIFRSVMNANLVGLLIAGIINVLISVYYYLNVTKVMYSDKGVSDVKPIQIGGSTGWVVGISAVALIALTVVSTPFWNLALDAARSFLS
jgi:NADH-quinone oxidoreductase subunit N